jgi:hypothetical protein
MHVSGRLVGGPVKPFKDMWLLLLLWLAIQTEQPDHAPGSQFCVVLD